MRRVSVTVALVCLLGASFVAGCAWLSNLEQAGEDLKVVAESMKAAGEKMEAVAEGAPPGAKEPLIIGGWGLRSLAAIIGAIGAAWIAYSEARKKKLSKQVAEAEQLALNNYRAAKSLTDALELLKVKLPEDVVKEMLDVLTAIQKARNTQETVNAIRKE